MHHKSTRTLFLFFFVSFLTLFNKSYSQGYTQNFDNITTLTADGWFTQNNSNPIGQNSWFQGNNITGNPTGVFDSYNGAPNAYIAANFNSTAGSSGIISNWLITPNRTIRNGDVFTFWTRRPYYSPTEEYPDRLEVRLSTNGASTNTGTTATSLGDFTTLLLSINPTLVRNVYPATWTQFTITISGLPAPTSGRIAFRYFVTGAGTTGVNSDYIGIDNVVYTPYVCPAFTMTAGGALTGGTAGTSYSYALTQTGSLGAPNFAITAGALPPGLTLQANGTISGTPTATGTFNFTATVNDASGCSGAQAYSITVVCPNIPITITTPSPVCGNTIVTLDASPAGGTFSGTGVSAGEFDPSVGTQTIYYDYTDPYGCAHSSDKTMTVIDPGITSVSSTTQSICSGTPITTITPSSTISGATFTWTRNNTSSVTGIAENGSGNITGTLTNTTGTPQTVEFTVSSDVNGCTNTATSSVVVNPAPAISCPGNISINNIINTCAAPATYAATASGVPAPTISYSFSGATTGSGNGTGSGSSFNVGVTTVTLTATNSCGSTNCSFTVTVNDTEKPTINCPAPLTVNCTGEIPTPDINSVTASDNCSGVTITFVDDVISNQTCANRYTVTRTYRATDNAGNSETCTQTITVDDQTPPVISCPADIQTTATGSCSTPVTFTVNATDNCGGAVTVTTLPASGSSFPLGTTTVTATATDACGNESTCTFTVTVADGQKAAIAAQPVNIAVCPGQDATFNITASNVVNYRWESLEGSNWESISGANSNTYTVPDMTESMSGNRYRVVLEGLCSTIYSNEVRLTLNQAPQPTINTPQEVCVEDRKIQLLATPAGGSFEGISVTGTTWNLEALPIGKHTINYTYTDANGCTASSSKIIDVRICNNTSNITVLNAYPNPSRGKTTVRTLVTAEDKYHVCVSDINGKIILRKDVNLRNGWNTFDVDLTTQKAGLYVITILRGNRKGEIKVIKVQ